MARDFQTPITVEGVPVPDIQLAVVYVNAVGALSTPRPAGAVMVVWTADGQPENMSGPDVVIRVDQSVDAPRVIVQASAGAPTTPRPSFAVVPNGEQFWSLIDQPGTVDAPDDIGSEDIIFNRSGTPWT